MLQHLGKDYPNTLPNLFNFNWQKGNTIGMRKKAHRHTKLQPQHSVLVLRNVD